MSDYSLILKSPPSQWTRGYFSDLCDRVLDTASPLPTGDRLYIGLEHLASGQPSLVGRGKESDITSGKTAFRKGDVLFGKLRPYLRKSVVAPEDGICSTDILVFRTRNDCPEYLCFLTHKDEFIAYARSTTSGVQHPRTSWAALREFKLHIPPTKEQKKIAKVLGLVQRAIEQQERIVALTVELKKLLLYHLFSHGMCNEPQKQTELGPVPRSWKIVSLGSVMGEEPKNGLYKHSSHYGTGTLILRINDFSNDGDIVTGASNRAQIDDEEQKTYCLRKDDIVVNRVNSLSHLGKTAVIGELSELMVFESNMMRFRADSSKVLPHFLLRWMNSPVYKAQVIGSAKRAVAQSSINQGNLRAISSPLPSLEEQAEIIDFFDQIEAKLSLHRRKHAALSALFRTLLHQLMTARIRVDNLDIEDVTKTDVTRRRPSTELF